MPFLDSVGFTNSEKRKIDLATKKLVSRLDPADSNYEHLKKELYLGVCRDVQAQRLPPDVSVPSRKNPLGYLKAIYENTGSARLAFLSYLSPGAWTSSGGSFKLAEDAGISIPDFILEK